MYRVLVKEYGERQVHSQTVGMETEVYAEEVVGKVLGAEGWLWRTRTIWAGGGAGTVWWLGLVLPEVGWEWIVSRMFGFDKLVGGGKKDV